MNEDKLPKEDETWEAKLSVMIEMISHHIEEEESTIFEDANEVIDETRIQFLPQSFQMEKEKIKSRLMEEMKVGMTR